MSVFTRGSQSGSYESFTERYRPVGGTLMFGCESRNSPIDGSSVKPCTPCPVVYTSIVLEP